MVLVLVAAAVAAAVTGDIKDTVAICAMVALNTLLGFRQEYRAERAMASLARMAAPEVRVRRSGRIQTVEARELVPGDIVLFEAGNLVPADARLIENWNLRVNEAALTGESLPVDKEALAQDLADAPLSERRNLVHRGTIVVYGRATAAVVRTGMQTELGRIAGLLKTASRPATPLEISLESAAQKLALIAVGLVAVIFAVGAARGEPLRTLFLTSISLAVAAVPEGLPTVIVVALALGSQRMLKRNVLIRKLSSIETLGQVSVICTDKTGTLTENRMAVTRIFAGGALFDLPLIETPDAAAATLLACGAMANDVQDTRREGRARWIGDPTEIALAEAAESVGLERPALEKSLPRVSETPFDSERKRMTTVHAVKDAAGAGVLPLAAEAASIAITKGAVESILRIAPWIWVDGRQEPLTELWRNRLLAANDDMASHGMRVLAAGFRPLESGSTESPLESNFIFAGLAGLVDPPRPEVREAVKKCRQAGIRPVMVTGDHPLTAAAIARELGIDEVHARVAPEDKLALVKTLQQQGHVVAMTGDGVNDSPALAVADVGIAMGRDGTDAAREAADIVLRDDNFASIVNAVEEGRVIYENIRKFIRYLLSCNSGELWLVLLAPLAGMPLPLTALQILWMNLVTDGLPALALSLEPAEHHVMRRPPRTRHQGLFDRAMLVPILWTGFLMGLIALLSGYRLWSAGRPEWQTVIFTVTTLSQLGLAMANRSEDQSLFAIGIASNRPLIGAIMLTVALQMALIYAPFCQNIFGTRSLSATELLLAIALSSVVFWGVESHKTYLRRRLLNQRSQSR
jgi:Ca2+-transporting ATPase